MNNSITIERALVLKRHLEDFISLQNAEIDTIVNHFKFKMVKKRNLLIREGDPVRNTHFVLKGLLVSKYYDIKGKEHVIQIAMENCWITDQNAFYNQTKAQFLIQALEDTEVLILNFASRENLCLNMHKMESFFRMKANDSFIKQQKRLMTYMVADAHQRYNLLIEEYPKLFQRVPKKVIASYLGVSRETLSRLGR